MVMLMLLIPVYSAITCGVMTGLSYHDCLSREERNLKRLLMVYLLMSGFGWFTTFAYRFYPELFVWLNTACMFVFMVTSIFHPQARATGDFRDQLLHTGLVVAGFLL